MSHNIRSSSLGYPNIGEGREWKKALEAFWSGKIGEAEFSREMETIRLERLRRQKDSGLDLVPVGDFTYYDRVLDTAAMFGIVPQRFDYTGGAVSLELYFAMARGNAAATACEMTKWFNTNYHYIVPELGGAEPRLTSNLPLRAFEEARAKLGITGKPVLVGPLTFLKLSKGYSAAETDAWLDRLLPLYGQVLAELQTAGAEWAQLDEPSVAGDLTEADWQRLKRIYTELASAAPQLKLIVQTYFDAPDNYEELTALPVAGIGLDFVHDRGRNFQKLLEQGFPAGLTLAAGVIDGRGIWRADLDAALKLVRRLQTAVPAERLLLQPSCSLLHVPVSLAGEQALGAALQGALAGADEKLGELTLLAEAAALSDAELSAGAGRAASAAAGFASSREALAALNALPERESASVRAKVRLLGGARASRESGFADRRRLQQQRWRLPFLPTTTIGSFPQTADIRSARAKWRKGTLDSAAYNTFIREQITDWIKLQEEIGLDVLVHGEFERTDMVEFFGEKLAGFAFTSNGWVQSYGSRCVKPPVIYGDVDFERPMTVEETVYAQSLTGKPVKGMLTGPVTILNWSFVRDDLSRSEVALQIALALRKEVEELEKAGIGMIQVDEPALREGLPLKKSRWPEELQAAVDAFRLATTGVADTTQIHTHMCYCEFSDIIDTIRDLDADVISIETSRSHGELIHSFEENTYEKGIGLGVYDIHSPRVPSVDEMVSMIERSLRSLDPELFWINPDCGLKTRGREETAASLANMVTAAQSVRTSRS
ncbi:5-methyltetrahydropteroyltriglutamate--homocysteine S-methyltransferase [Paenibacillus pasadenensis]|uniref:5-methyltetrahydropteroyltriglutamate-- homocysteine S-methyltransferase n=1 Tax=Paenibacillus pasadenensis TaxID=217090 RepID=UPI00203B8C22|nr:5-methyltetrahydropteroyltriglutamate--homocysteine S-methyltransferase [Paenibacillus pasadenensis]MCM3748381.1 5-methyltetrahydropteroyltriglutamate--homocysteine S-methyltransferase [Paenibacillus pasadenensis]